MSHALRRRASTTTVFVACLALAAAVAIDAGRTIVSDSDAAPLSARLDVVPTPSGWPDDEPFGQVLPPASMTPGSEAAQDYVDRIEAATPTIFDVESQVVAHYLDRGLAGTRVVDRGARLVVFWRGTAPDHVRTTLGGRPHGVDVRLVEGARYSQQELEVGLRRLFDHIADRRGHYRIGSRWRIVTTEPRSDGSGLSIDVFRKKPTPAAQRRIAELTGVELTDISFRVMQTTDVLVGGRTSVEA